MFWIPLSGAIAEASGNVIEKKILKCPEINYKNYTVYGFLAIVLLSIPLLFFYWDIKSEAYAPINLLILFGVIIFSLIANLLVFYSLKRESLTELEPIRLMQPLFTILIAFCLSFFFIDYASERNYSILILGLIASFALIGAHIRKHHIKLNKYILAALLGSLFFSVEMVISKFILVYYSSITFYFIRCLLIFIITLIIFHPRTVLKTKTKILTLITAGIWIFYRTILYYGYMRYGVVFTTLLFILTPVFIFIFAKIFLKEKIGIRNIISSIIIVACVAIAIIIQEHNAIISIIRSLI
ncbi:MAG: EamA family transporter [Candidatus Pacearchaeota archaeon]